MKSGAASIHIVLVHVIVGVLLIYFSCHALAGDNGLARWIELQREASRLQEEIVAVREHNADLRMRLIRLRDDSIDLDYIEEIARRRLFMVHPDDIVIAVPEQQPP